MRSLLPFATLAIALCACTPDRSSPPAGSTAVAQASTTTSPASASTTVGDAVLHTSTIALGDLEAAVASRYGIDAGKEGMLLLVTVRDAAGDALAPGDLQLQATAAVLPEGPRPLELRMIEAAGMTDYIGVVETRAPASIQFRLGATRGTSRAELATTAELLPR